MLPLVSICLSARLPAGRPPARSAPIAAPSLPVALLLGVALMLCVALPPASADPGHHQRIEHLETQLSERPHDIALLCRKAEALRLAGAFDLARRSLAEAEREAPGDPAIALERALLSLDENLIDAALEDAHAAVRAMPHEPSVWLARAEAFARSGAHALAAADLDRAIALQPVPRPEHFLERARQRVAIGDDAGALEGLDAAVASMGPVIALEREAIDIEMRAGRFDEALSRHARLAEQYARPEAATIERGDLLARAGRLPVAIVAWTEALTLLEQREVTGPRDAGLTADLRARLVRAAMALRDQP